MRHKDLSVVWIQCGSLIIHISRFFVIAIKGCNIVFPVTNGTQKLTVHVVQIALHVPVSVARQQEGVLSYLDAFHGFFFNIVGHLFFD